MPDFDNIDLAIGSITIVLLVVGITLALKGNIEAGLGLMGTGIAAIAGLAKGVSK